MTRVLDLGCGAGLTPRKLSLPAVWQIVGLDANYEAVRSARRSFPQRVFVCSRAEKLPFPDSTFDQIIANVALPYMNIPRALAETYRVLAPGGTFLASLHPWRFTIAEFRNAFPKPKAMLYRLFVFANGIAFHAVGRNFGETFQTERGIRIAFRRANFTGICFRHDGKRWLVEARKSEEGMRLVA
jgi:ubiquinone/menaquinone biosynthesis C-methylase UbiE